MRRGFVILMCWAAGRILGLRATVHAQTRVFVSDQADVEINSPGEPGVAYVMGAGFVRPPTDSGGTGELLAALRRGAQERNRPLIERIDGRLKAIAPDYAEDVAADTPGGSRRPDRIAPGPICATAGVVARGSTDLDLEWRRP